MKLSSVEFAELQLLMAHVAHLNCEKDLIEIASYFTNEAIINIRHAAAKVEKASDIVFWRRQLELFPNSRVTKAKLEYLLKND